MGKFVEFFGPGVAQLSIADRATIANMCPEYGATAAFFPVDAVSIQYLEQTGAGPLTSPSHRCQDNPSNVHRLSRTGPREAGLHHRLPEGRGDVQRLHRHLPGPRLHPGLGPDPLDHNRPGLEL